MTKIESLLKDERIFYPPQEGKDLAYIKSRYQYDKIYDYSLKDPDGFWTERAKELITWFRYWDRTCYWDFNKAEIRFFEGGKLNASYNCLDRHLLNPHVKNKAAIIWQGEHDRDLRVYTYQMLHDEVCRFANILKSLGVKKGDRVVIYMPTMPEVIAAMLACARIGAIHVVVYGGLSAEALKSRILDAGAKILITADGTYSGGRRINLLNNAETAIAQCECIEKYIVINRFGEEITLSDKRGLLFDELIKNKEFEKYCPCEEMDAEDILFILYTSGSTGKPKGIYHTTGGYLVYAAHTTQWVFDLRPEDIIWRPGAVGWITFHTYVVYSPLALGATVFIYDGLPDYPNPGRWWELVDRFKVTILYLTPTNIRAFMKEREDWPAKYDLSTLRILGTVGEPINPEVWIWYHKNVGKGRIPVVDTWWQTETGGHLISPLPYTIPQKPGSVTLPLPGIEPVIFRDDGTSADINESGHLCIKGAWPGIARGLWGDSEKFKEIYFSRFPGYYFTGDQARVDEDGYFWIMGRLDDVISVSGYLIRTSELESVFVAHSAVAEAAVVGMPHEIKGEVIYAYIVLKDGFQPSEELKKNLIQHITKEIGPLVIPEVIQFVNDLPKTRSGKIMRRILRKVAAGVYDDLGDKSTLANPDVVEKIIQGRKEIFGK
ncbi:acetyl-CoA synthetase [Thermodesulfovibrio aggregans]|uniref:Acetate--CoA ligase n=1 Tax=Thermodesulfovibrio aggregans TaxID=86166 RepID=A0A0U9HQ15_9BACT|nr:acetate--CoA ligase [Thermodesulfovibrio aggregans]GAQ94553.1 acetyl-CoA synthetase [Thermodesulfovibrio aggregans]